MSLGSASIATNQKREPANLPAGLLTNAENGLSVFPAGTAVLGQDVNQPGNPAQLFSIREIPMNGQQIVFKGPLQPVLLQEEIRFFESGFISLAGAYLSSFGPGISLNNLNGGQIANIGFVDNGVGQMYFSINDGNSFLKLDIATGQMWFTQSANDNPPNFASFSVVGALGSTGSLFGRREFVDGNVTPFPIDPNFNRAFYVNTSLGNITYDLNGSGIGAESCFEVTVPGFLIINPGALSIRVGATLGAPGATLFSILVGSTITLRLNDQSQWVVTEMQGVWSF